jgi:DNA processing protein
MAALPGGGWINDHLEQKLLTNKRVHIIVQPSVLSAWRTYLTQGQGSSLEEKCSGLAVRGEVPAPLVAIVGTRRPSPAAADAAFTVAKLLARAGIGVVSGLALGIDAAAHRGCLAGGGRTVAVLGHGLEARLYPAQHTALAETIITRGALVSPFDARTTVSRQTLLARNQWIASLACAVWVVQTGLPGGALTAAAHARRLGIPVLATPWDDPAWMVGYQSLLQHGAESVDVLTAATRLQALCACGKRSKAQGELAL